MTRTVVHLLRHGEVHNPEGVLYGRLPGYRLAERGERMAERVADYFAGAFAPDDAAPRRADAHWAASASPRPTAVEPGGIGSPTAPPLASSTSTT